MQQQQQLTAVTQTELTIKVSVSGQFVSSFQPNAQQRVAEAIVSLENGRFATPESVNLQTKQPVDIRFEDDGHTLKIVSNATVLLNKKTGIYTTVFATNLVVLSGMLVSLDNCPIALTGSMKHRLNTGTLFVGSTNNPQGNTLNSSVQSRVLSLKP